MTPRRLNKTRIIGFGTIVLIAVLLGWLSIHSQKNRRILGSWNLDFDNTYLYSNSDSVEFLNGWIIIHDNGYIDLPPQYMPNCKIQNALDESKGTWTINKYNDSLFINAPIHLFHGKYLIKEQRVKKGTQSLDLLKLSNDSNEIVLYR